MKAEAVTPSPPALQNKNTTEGKSILWKGFTIVGQAFYEAVSYSTLFLIGAIALRSMKSQLSWGFLGIGSGLFISKLVINVVDSYNDSTLREFKIKVCNAYDEYPKIRTICSLFAVAIGCLLPSIGLLLGIIGGVMLGITLKEELRKEASRNQETRSPV